MIPKRSSNAWALGLALVTLTVLAYIPAANAGFIWDDDKYVTENRVLTRAGGLEEIWIPGNTPQYYPLVFTSFWIEHRIWGTDATGYHLVNIVLHALNAVLVWRLCRALRIPAAWWIAAVFALHPVHVESVAWVTERKNVLSGFFYLLAALAYLRFERERADTTPPSTSRAGAPWSWYGGSLVLFVLALLSKTVTCSLPAALILFMALGRERITIRRLAPLVPMFAIGIVLALHTAQLEKTLVGARGPDFDFTFVERSLIACRGLLFYPLKLLVPWPLMFVYPRWEIDADSLASYWPVVAVVLVAVAAIASFTRGVRAPAVALAFFAGSLFPALGFFDVFPMRYSYVADHFQYLASLGIIALVVGGIARVAPSSRTSALIGVCALASLAALTWRQCRMYVDQESLWRETSRQNPSAWIAHTNLAKILSERGDHEEALDRLQRASSAVRSSAALQQIRLNLAVTLTKLGRYDEALVQYQAIERSSGGMEIKLAQTLERLGRDDEAEALYRKSLERQLDPDALVSFGVHLLRRDRPLEAIVWLEKCVDLQPKDPGVRMFLADAFAAGARLGDAIACAERALDLARASGDGHMSELIRLRLAQYRASEAPR